MRLTIILSALILVISQVSLLICPQSSLAVQQTLAAPVTPQPKASHIFPQKELPHNWLFPVQGKLTNPFGNGYWYYGVYRGGHTGIDIKAQAGAPVLAVTSGRVVLIHPHQDRRYGHYVVVQHDSGFYTLYGHLGRILVKQRQLLQPGEQLGDVGQSGAAGYPHLHFEVLNQIPVRDGAWGYAYICRQPPQGQHLLYYNFLNLAAREMSVIRRQKANFCIDIPLKKALIYYNPELFFDKYEFKPWMSEFQPENEEISRWKKIQKSPRFTAVYRP